MGMKSIAAMLLVLILGASPALAGGGILGLDHELGYDNGGIWARRYQVDLQFGVILTEVAGALWLGDEDRLGHEFWQSIDATAVSGVAAQLLKVGFSRARPYQNLGPDKWFQGKCCQSFPSGEVTLQAAFVTPIILGESARGNDWAWALELLPVYDGIGRMKQQAHWQSDVIAAWLLGSAAGYWSAHRDIPLSVQILPQGFSVGFQKRF